MPADNQDKSLPNKEKPLAENTNIRNIYIYQGNYNENIKGNYYAQNLHQPSSDKKETKKKRSRIITSGDFSKGKFEQSHKNSLFIGRTKEIEKLEKLLISSQSESTSQITVIWGIPGVGKSALAYSFARKHHYQKKFPGGVYIVRVDEFKDQPDPLKSLARWFAEKKEGDFSHNDSRNPSEMMEDCFADDKTE